MVGRPQLFLRFLNARLYGTVTLAQAEASSNSRQDALKSPFRCIEDNPTFHNFDHEGKFYRIAADRYQRLFTFRGFHQDFKELVKTFQECCIMVRRPAIEVISHFNRTNFELPVNRYVLFGVEGSGKTITLGHMTHLISCQPDWLLLHAGWIPRWVRNFKESAPSASRPGRFDLPLDAVAWLQHFKTQNATLLQEKKLNIENTYTWSLREKTEKGQPLTNLIEQGLVRPKFSSDCVAAILKESKLLAKSGQIKVATIIDGVNSIFGRTRIKREDRSWVNAEDVTIIRAFKKLLRNDWNNGIVLTSVDVHASPMEQRHSPFPRYLLTKEGFELMDPFIPITVENYSLKEINSCLDYYIDRLYLQSEKGRTDNGRQQLIFLSGNNPLTLRNVCGPL